MQYKNALTVNNERYRTMVAEYLKPRLQPSQWAHVRLYHVLQMLPGFITFCIEILKVHFELKT